MTFRNADLRQLRLLDTDVRKIAFTSVDWPERGGKTYLYDDLVYIDKLKAREAAVPWPFRPDERAQWAAAVPWGKLERLYRQLKQNHEESKDFSQGGDFHYREKEMQRENPDCTPGRRVLLWLYKHLGGYGERVGPPLVAFLVLTVLCFGVYLAAGGAGLEAAHHSLKTAFLLRPPPLAGMSEGAAIVQTLQTIMSPVLLGLLALAIRQRVKR